MVDYKDSLVPLSEIGSLPPLNGVSGIHRSTFHRWRTRGIAGVCLDCFRLGGVWFTSQRKLEDFLHKIQGESNNRGCGG